MILLTDDDLHKYLDDALASLGLYIPEPPVRRKDNRLIFTGSSDDTRTQALIYWFFLGYHAHWWRAEQ